MADDYYTADEIDDIEEYPVWVLPFNSTLGFPQRTNVRVVNDLFIIKYKINGYDDSFIMEIKRSIDEVIMFHGKIVEDYLIYIRTPETGIIDYCLIPRLLTRERIDVWLIPLDEMFTEI